MPAPGKGHLSLRLSVLGTLTLSVTAPGLQRFSVTSLGLLTHRWTQVEAAPAVVVSLDASVTQVTIYGNRCAGHISSDFGWFVWPAFQHWYTVVGLCLLWFVLEGAALPLT